MAIADPQLHDTRLELGDSVRNSILVYGAKVEAGLVEGKKRWLTIGSDELCADGKRRLCILC